MLFPIALAIIAAIFFASSNHIDKYLISKAVKHADYRALILVSAFISGGAMTLIYLFVCNFNLSFDLSSILLLLLDSIFMVVALIFWFKALDREDVTVVSIMLQLIPVFTLFIAPIFLDNQNISPVQLAGGAIITLAAVLITYEPSKRKFDKNRVITLAMMVAVSFLYAIYDVIIRYVNQNHDFNQTIFWLNLTLLVVGILIFLFVKPYRKSFCKMLKSNGLKVISLNLANELLYSFGNVILTFAGTMTSIALVSFVSQGTSPFMVMLIGILITKLFPKVEKEKVSRKEIVKRTVTIIFCIIGLACTGFG